MNYTDYRFSRRTEMSENAAIHFPKSVTRTAFYYSCPFIQYFQSVDYCPSCRATAAYQH